VPEQVGAELPIFAKLVCALSQARAVPLAV
jgi:hypothetical protein